MLKSFSPLLLLPAFFLGLRWQDAPKEQEPAPGIGKDIYGRPLKTDAKLEELHQGIQGCWKLVAIDDAFLPQQGRVQAGYLLIAPDFLAIEVHIEWNNGYDELEDDDFQSGIHEYRLDGTGELVTSLMIGSFLDDDDGNIDLAWEQPGSLRNFQLKLTGNFLDLRRPDGSRLSFSRILPRRKGPKDVFGRSISPTPDGEPSSVDVFGRRRKRGEKKK